MVCWVKKTRAQLLLPQLRQLRQTTHLHLVHALLLAIGQAFATAAMAVGWPAAAAGTASPAIHMSQLS
jgi:hypothetical protein